jgi:hypothetical protein
MNTAPDPGHPVAGHPHRTVHRDHRNWPAPTFQPQTGPTAGATGDTGPDPGADNQSPWDDQLGWDDNEVGDPWAFDDPLRNLTAVAYTDNDTAALIRETAQTLTIYREGQLGDAGATVSVLVSLAAEADTQLWEAVADAHDQGYTWADIADRLATSVTTARRRYAAYTNWRNTQPLKPD